jgi:hypothetical protein
MYEIFRSKVVAGRNYLSCELIYFLFVPIKKVLLNIFFQIAFTIFEEEVKIVDSLFHIEELDDVGVL